MANITDGFVVLTDEVWDGFSTVITQLTGNIYNVDGYATGSTSNVAETTTGTFEDTNNDGRLSDLSDFDPQEVYSANAGATLSATSDFLLYTIEVQSDVTLLDGTVINGVTLDVMVLENNQILFDFDNGDLATHFNGSSPIASIEITGSTQNTYDYIFIAAHDDAYAPICFTSDTLIETAAGPTRIEQINVGDLVLTRDHGYQSVRWIGSRHFSGQELEKEEKLGPVVFAPGSLGGGRPESALRVSRQHRMLVSSKISQRMFECESVLIAAIRMVGQPGVTLEKSRDDVNYVHLLFDHHEVIFANGVPSESLHLGQETMRSLSTESCREIFSIFPNLATIKNGPKTKYAIPEPKRQKRFVQRHSSNHTPITACDKIPVADELYKLQALGHMSGLPRRSIPC